MPPSYPYFAPLSNDPPVTSCLNCSYLHWLLFILAPLVPTKKKKTDVPQCPRAPCYAKVRGKIIVRNLTLAYAKEAASKFKPMTTNHQGTTLPLCQGSPSLLSQQMLKNSNLHKVLGDSLNEGGKWVVESSISITVSINCHTTPTT